MTVFLTWLKIIPTILSTVMSTIAALEQGFQEVAGATGNSAAQTGATKLNVVQAGLGPGCVGRDVADRADHQDWDPRRDRAEAE